MIESKIRAGIKELVIERLRTLNGNSKILLLGFDKPLTVNELLEQVRKDSPLGRKIVEVQYKYIQMLAKGEL